MRAHHKLRAWQEAMDLVDDVYRLAALFPASERFGLAAQMRRSAVSVPSNIAEGAARSGRKEFKNFLMIARGSLSELDTQLRIAQRLGFARTDESLIAVERLFALLAGLIRVQSKGCRDRSSDVSRAAQPRPSEAAPRPPLRS